MAERAESKAKTAKKERKSPGQVPTVDPGADAPGAVSMLDLVLQTFFLPEGQTDHPERAFDAYYKFLKWKEFQLHQAVAAAESEAKTFEVKDQMTAYQAEYKRLGDQWSAAPTRRTTEAFYRFRTQLLKEVGDNFQNPDLTKILKDDWEVLQSFAGTDVLQTVAMRKEALAKEMQRLAEALQGATNKAAKDLALVKMSNKPAKELINRQQESLKGMLGSAVVARNAALGLWQDFLERLNLNHEKNTIAALTMVREKYPRTLELLDQLVQEHKQRRRKRSPFDAGDLEPALELKPFEIVIDIPPALGDWSTFPRVDESEQKDLATEYARQWAPLQSILPVCKVKPSASGLYDVPSEETAENIGIGSESGLAGYQQTVIDLASPYNKQSKGYLLYYAPGLGKTRAAKEILVKYFSSNDADFKIAGMMPMVLILVPNNNIALEWQREISRVSLTLDVNHQIAGGTTSQFFYSSRTGRAILIQLMSAPVHPKVALALDPAAWKTLEIMQQRWGTSATENPNLDPLQKEKRYLFTFKEPREELQRAARPDSESVRGNQEHVFVFPWQGLILVDEADKIADPVLFDPQYKSVEKRAMVTRWCKILEGSGPFCRIFLLTGTPQGSGKNLSCVFRMLNLLLYPGMPRVDPGYEAPLKPTAEEIRELNKLNAENNTKLLAWLKVKRALVSMAYQNLVLHVDIQSRPKLLAVLTRMDKKIYEIVSQEPGTTVTDKNWRPASWKDHKGTANALVSGLHKLTQLFPFVPVIYPLTKEGKGQIAKIKKVKPPTGPIPLKGSPMVAEEETKGKGKERAIETLLVKGPQLPRFFAGIAASVVNMAVMDEKWGFHKHLLLCPFVTTEHSRAFIQHFKELAPQMIGASSEKWVIFGERECEEAMDSIGDYKSLAADEKEENIARWAYNYWHAQHERPLIIFNCLTLSERERAKALPVRNQAARQDWVFKITTELWNAVENQQLKSPHFFFMDSRGAVGVNVFHARVLHTIAPPDLTTLEQTAKRIQRLCGHEIHRALETERLEAWAKGTASHERDPVTGQRITSREKARSVIAQEIKKNQIWCFVYFANTPRSKEPLIVGLQQQEEISELQKWLKSIAIDCQLWKSINGNVNCFRTQGVISQQLMPADRALLQPVGTTPKTLPSITVVMSRWADPRVSRFVWFTEADPAPAMYHLPQLKRPTEVRTFKVNYGLHLVFLFFLLQTLFPVIVPITRIQKACWFFPKFASKLAKDGTMPGLSVFLEQAKYDGRNRGPEDYSFMAVYVGELRELVRNTMKVHPDLTTLRTAAGAPSGSVAPTGETKKAPSAPAPPKMTLVGAPLPQEKQQPTPAIGEYLQRSDLRYFLQIRTEDYKGDDGSWMEALLQRPEDFTDLEILSILFSLTADQVAFIFGLAHMCSRTVEESVAEPYRWVSFIRIAFVLDQLSLLLDLSRLRQLYTLGSAPAQKEEIMSKEIKSALDQARERSRTEGGSLMPELSLRASPEWASQLRAVFQQIGSVIEAWKSVPPKSVTRATAPGRAPASQGVEAALAVLSVPPQRPPASVLDMPVQSTWGRTAMRQAQEQW